MYLNPSIRVSSQDQVIGARVGSVADGFEHLLEPILDDPVLSAHARLSQIRLLPNDVGHWWSASRRRSRARKYLYGRA